MKNIEGYIKWLGRVRAVQRKAAAVVLAFSIAVSGNVFWLMRTTGNAMSEEPVCGLEEHKHTDECYEKVLICEDADHEHTDECYETRLTCGLSEHTHSEGCYIDVSARENKEDWEKTIPELTGDRRADLMSVASSQIGYEEGADGYSRYGDWYGNPEGDWNVMFVSFCLNYAGISKEEIPYGSGCWAWQVKLNEAGLLVTDMTEAPLPGDILLTDNDGDGKSDCAGIVISIDDSIVSVVEGDVDGKVDAVQLQISDSKILGFLSVSSLDTEDNPVQDASEPSEEPVEDTGLDFEAKTASGISVCAKAPEGAFPDGVTMTAEDVNDKDIISRAEEAAGKKLGDKEEVKGTIAVDITFRDSDGNEVEPGEGKNVDVTITIPDIKKLEGDDYQLFHVNESGVSEVKNATVTDNEAAFSSDGFSIYVFTATGQRDKDEVHAYISTAGMVIPPDQMNGDYIRNTIDYPYMLKPGDEIVLIGKVDDGSYPSFSCDRNNVTVTNTSSAANEVRATIRAVSDTGWRYDEASDSWKRNPVVVRLSGTDEVFYISVNGVTNWNETINLDDIPSGTTREVEVKYHSTIRIVGTPVQANHTPWRPQSENPGGEILTHVDYIYNQGGQNGRIFVANTYDIDNNDEVVVMTTTTGEKKVRIIVKDDFPDVIDHADLEIADGGKYTSVVIEGGGEEGLYKTITTYQSYVNTVNSCNLYDANNNNVFIFHRDEVPEYPWPTTSCVPFNPPHFVSDDYWHDPNYHPGDSQYELTSKYKLPPGKSWGQADATYSKKRFYYSDVDHARFDVGLDVVPQSSKTYVWNGTGWDYLADEDVTYVIDFDNDIYTRTYKGETVSINIEEYTEKVPHEIFNLNRTAVIDAYNKCPNHTGLDFTVHANSALLQFEAKKNLIGRDLAEGEFEFGIYTDPECATTPVATARNEGDGKVEFDRMIFNEDGEFTYYMKEIKGDLEDITYDRGIYRVEVKIEDTVADIVSFMRQDESGNWSTADKFLFQNMYKFRLPDTGGSGVIPLFAAGTLMIGGALALILLMLRRRKEEDL